MRIVHSADWHIGATLNGWARDDEHRIFFAELADLLRDREVDALLITGDVYDNLNPSGESQKLLYDAVVSLRLARPGLQIIMTSGNHDPAGRLEAPMSILAAHGCRIVGTLRRRDGEPDYGAHLLPLLDAEGRERVLVAAIPFLRASDLPGLTFAEAEGGVSPVVEAVRAFHHEVIAAAAGRGNALPMIAMGHLTCVGGAETEAAERRILIGGEHSVPHDVFGPEFSYVALGHLHMPQSIDGGRIRYSGSCFPLSVTEAPYAHGVTLLELAADGFRQEHVPMRRPARFIRVPERGQARPEDLARLLEALDLDPDLPQGARPFVYVQLSATGPASAILAEAQRLLAGHPVRVADIRILREAGPAAPEGPPRPVSLSDTNPEDLFIEEFRRANLIDPEARHMAAYRDAVAEV